MGRSAKAALATSILVGAGLLVPAGGASGRAGNDLLELRGLNVIRVDATTGIEVRLPRDAAVTMNVHGPRQLMSRDVTVESSGSLAGIVLIENGPVVEAAKFLGLQGRWCAPEKCGERGIYSIGHAKGTTVDEENAVQTIPAGTYTLYVVAQGGPATVRVRLRGLEGRRSVELEGRRASSSIARRHPGATSFSAPAGFSTYWAGRSVGLHGIGGFFFAVLRSEGGPWIRGRNGGCIYRDEPPPSPVAFAPRCPGGQDTAIESGIIETRFEHLNWLIAFAEPHGVWSFGQYYYAVANVEKRSQMTFALDIDPARLGEAR